MGSLTTADSLMPLPWHARSEQWTVLPHLDWTQTSTKRANSSCLHAHQNQHLLCAVLSSHEPRAAILSGQRQPLLPFKQLHIFTTMQRSPDKQSSAPNRFQVCNRVKGSCCAFVSDGWPFLCRSHASGPEQTHSYDAWVHAGWHWMNQ